MPFVNVKIIENTFTPEQKREVISKITDVMVSIEGEPFRGVTWVTIDEVPEGQWGIAGKPLLMADIERIRNSGAPMARSAAVSLAPAK